MINSFVDSFIDWWIDGLIEPDRTGLQTRESCKASQGCTLHQSENNSNRLCLNQIQLSGKLTQVPGKVAKKIKIYMSLKPSNMISMQFLTITLHLIIKFCVDPYSRHRFLTFLSKIIKNRHKTILLASRSHQKWILNVFLYRTNPKWSDLNRLKQFFNIYRAFCWLSWHLVTS